MANITSIQIGDNYLKVNNTHAIDLFISSMETLNNYGRAYFPLSDNNITRRTDIDNSIFELKNNKLYFKKKGIIQVNTYAIIVTKLGLYWLSIRAQINDRDDHEFIKVSANENADEWTIIASGSGSTVVQANDYLGVFAETETSKTINNCFVSVIFTEI